MYSIDRPINDAQNLLALAQMAERAEDTKRAFDLLPLQTEQGTLDRWDAMSWVETVRPAALMWGRAGLVFVAIAGLNSRRDGLAFYDGQCGWNSNPALGGGNRNQFTLNWATQVYNQFSIASLGQASVVIAGHSAGGPTAVMLAKMIQEVRPNSQIQVVTFGSPYFCDATRARDYERFTVYRVMSSGDIVPYLLPKVTVSPVFNALLNPIQYFIVNTLVHVGRGIRIKAGAAMEANDTPFGILTPVELNPSSTIEALTYHSSHPHNIDTYVSILQGIVDSQRPSPEVVHMPSTQEEFRGHGLTMREAEREWRANREITVVPQMRPDSGPEVGVVKVARSGGAWYVLVNGITVYNATSKRDARGVAIALRRLRTQILQNDAGFVLPEAMLPLLAGAVPFQG